MTTTRRQPSSPSDASVLALVFVSPSGRMVRIRAPADGQSLVIGRDAECDLVIDDASVSRKHARIVGGHPPTMVDLGSTNGTKLAGAPLEPNRPAPLRRGAFLSFGDVQCFAQPALPSDVPGGKLLVERPRLAATGLPQAAIAHDPAMLEAYALLPRFALTNVSVAIFGETGVGKEVYAEGVHRLSMRAGKPFVKLNCAALPESILEAELFGYERGAFTGAVQAKAGLFESAEGGTVLLDEIGDMPLTTQAKLLRVLENGEVLRLGSVRPLRIDVRFLCATHRDLEALSATGGFRSDLFYRLTVLAVWIPPLRRRPLDIAPLARKFLRDAGACDTLLPEVFGVLAQHAWPGNVRELRNVIQRAAVLSGGEEVRREHLVFGPPKAAPAREAAAPAPAPAPPVSATSLDESERVHIMAVLDSARGNRKRAAELLGISRTTLLKKLDAYGIERIKRP